MLKFKFCPTRVYNMDETGITTVQDPGKIIGAKGQKRIGSVTSWERGKNNKVICAMSALGSFIPPLFIFPHKRMDMKLTKHGPPGAVYECTKNGWTTEDIFMKWLKHFKHHSNPTKENPVLLILDNHGSHISLQTYEFCRENHIIMLSLFPHTSHRMQPLDVTFFGPLKSAFRRECDNYIKSHAMIKITPFEIAELFNKAYSQVATIQKGISGFSATGIFPLNPEIFTDEDFYASLTFNQDDTVHETPIIENETPVVIENETPVIFENESLTPTDSNNTHHSMDTSPSVSIQEISPIPKIIPKRVTQRVTAKQYSSILTASPMKFKLEEREKKRKEKKDQKLKKKRMMTKKKEGKKSC